MISAIICPVGKNLRSELKDTVSSIKISQVHLSGDFQGQERNQKKCMAFRTAIKNHFPVKFHAMNCSLYVTFQSSALNILVQTGCCSGMPEINSLFN